MNSLHPGGKSGRHDSNFVPRLEDAPRNPPRVTTKIMPLVTLRADHPLNRKAGINMVLLTPDVDILQMIEQRRTLIPRRLT